MSNKSDEFLLYKKTYKLLLVITINATKKSMSQAPTKPSVYTIGIAGGSGAGKTTLASKLYDELGGAQNVTYMVHDSYYRDQSHKSMEERTRTNFDHPDSLETELLIEHIRDLKAGSIVQIPAYDFTTHTRLPQSKAIALAGPRPILLIEGILILCHPELVKEMDLKVYVVSCMIFLREL
jgi:uridine kinase